MTIDEIRTLAKQIFDTKLFEIAGTPLTGATLLILVAIALFTFWVGRASERMVEGVLTRRTGRDDGTAGALARLLRYVVLVIGLSVGLHTAGINLSALFAAGALFAVAIGFAMQNVVANFVSGIILLAERAIKPGDVLEVEGTMVQVEDLGIRATIVRTLDSDNLILPNSQLVQSTVKNLTLRDRFYRLRVVVGVSYDADQALVKDTLMKTLEELAWRSREHEPVVLLVDFGASSVDWEASVWIENPWSAKRGKSDLREAIWWAFQEARITIAYPQLDLHLDEPVVESLRGDRVA